MRDEDSATFGSALAKTMDRLDKLETRGDLDGYELAEVLVIACFIKPYEDRDTEMKDDAMESMVFVDGTTQLPYVQAGILELAKDTALGVP